MNIEPVNIPDGNVLLVNKSKKPKLNEIFFDFEIEMILTAVDGSDTSSAMCHPIIASITEIDPSIPLFREEDLKGKDRYELRVGICNVCIYDLNEKTPLIIVSDQFQKQMQDYCNYLNSKHEEVDVEELALKYSNKYSHCSIEEQRYRNRGFVAGFNANKQGGYSEENMRRAICLAHMGGADGIGYDHTTEDEILLKIKPPTTIKLKEENGVIVIQEIDGKQYVIFE